MQPDSQSMPIEAGSGPAGPAGQGEPLVLPHRAAAVTAFSLIGLACWVATAGVWASIRLGLVSIDGELGQLALYLSLLTLPGCVICCVAAWTMATTDLASMAAGRTDPSGRWLTVLGKLLAVGLLLAGAALALLAMVLTIRGDAPWPFGE
jgi:hypothetical protein